MTAVRAPERLSAISIQIGYQCYFLALLLVYLKFIPEYFSYEGYVEELSISRVAMTVPLVAALVALLVRQERTIAFLLHLGMQLIIVPTVVLFCGADKSVYYLAVTVFGFLIVVFASSLFRFRSITAGNISPNLLLWVLVSIVYGTMFAMTLLGSFRYFNLNFADVYLFRQDAEENLPGVFGYIVPIVTKVIIPISVLLSFEGRHWVRFLLLISSSVLFFGLTSHKAIVFYPWIVLAIYWFVGSRRPVLTMLMGLTAIVLICGLAFWFARSDEFIFLGSLLLRRALIVPANLNSLYIEWFSYNPFILWSESKLTFGLLESPYDFRAVNLIGLEYFDRSTMAANAGWIGSGYANAGIGGVAFYSMAIGFLLSLLGRYAQKIGDRFIVAAFSPMLITAYLSSDYVTSFFTHGILVALMVITVIARHQRPRSIR